MRLGSGEAEGRVEGKGKGKGAAGTKPRRKGEGRGEGLAAAAVVGQTKRVAEMQRRKRGKADGGRFMWPGRIAGKTRFLCKVGATVGCFFHRVAPRWRRRALVWSAAES